MNKQTRTTLILTVAAAVTVAMSIALGRAPGDDHGHDHPQPSSGTTQPAKSAGLDEHGHDHGNGSPASRTTQPATARGHDEHGHDHGHDHPDPASPATQPAKAGGHDDHDHGHDHPEPASPATQPAKAGGHDDHDHGHDHPDPASPATQPAKAGGHDDHGHDHGEPASRTKQPAKSDSHDEHGHDHGEAGHVDEVKLTSEAIKSYGIRVAPAQLHTLAPTVSVTARVSFNSDAMAHVGASVRGRATEIKVRVGDQVSKGDELVIVQSPELGEAQSDFLQKRTAVSVAGAAIGPARSGAERARRLYEQSQGIALGEVQKREAELKAAEGALQTAQAAATAAENKLHLLGMDQKAVHQLMESSEIDPTYVVRAPIEGQIIEREITLGELVSPEKEALMVIADTRNVWVIADVPEARLREVKPGAEARVRISAASDEAVVGRVSFIAAMLDSATRTAQVRVQVPNPDSQFRPGMFATAEIIAATGADGRAVLAVPDDAVQTVEGTTSVFVPVAGEANTFARRAVSVGPAVGGVRAVLSGLKEGDAIVVNGTFILKAELGKGQAEHSH